MKLDTHDAMQTDGNILEVKEGFAFSIPIETQDLFCRILRGSLAWSWRVGV